MTTQNAPKAGDFTLSTEIFLATYQSELGTNEPLRIDIREAVQEIQIFEGINYNTLSGTLVMVDAGGLLDRLPITGNEILEFTLHTPGFTLEDESPRGYNFKKYPMWVNKIRNISNPNQNARVYALDFYSKERIRDNQRKLCRAFEGPIHETVNVILRNFLKTQKDFLFETTTPVVKYVIPKKSPLDTIKFLGKESISEKFENSGFFFWETSDGFNFKSLEAMISNSAGKAKQSVIEYSNSPKVDSGQLYDTKDGVKGNMTKVFEFNILKRFDTLSNIKQGTYASRLVTYNAFTKQFKNVDFSYPHEYTKSNHMGQEEFPDSPYTSIMPVYNYEEGKLLSDFPEADYMFTSSTIGMHDKKITNTVPLDKDPIFGLPLGTINADGTITNPDGTIAGTETTTIKAVETADIENTLQKSKAQRNAFNSFVIELVVPGNTAVTAGSVIKFKTLSGNIPEGKNDLLIDPFLSGNYLVTEVRHLAQTTPQGIHTMTLTCAKDSVGTEYIPNDKEVLNSDMTLVQGYDYNQFTIDES